MGLIIFLEGRGDIWWGQLYLRRVGGHLVGSTVSKEGRGTFGGVNCV